MGVVYEARDGELDREVAIKVLHARHPTADEASRLLREAQALARLSHPNVIEVFDVGLVDERLFVAMERFDGQTLSAWLKAAPRAWTEIRDVLLAAGQGIVAAHEAGLVHRDFKPDNVMIGRDGRVVVLDFGLALSTDDAASLEGSAEVLEVTGELSEPLGVDSEGRLTETGHRLGTPAYMAPEQWTRGELDERTDQFSFCVTAYEALYGERPFAAATRALLAVEVTRGNVREAPEGSRVPPWLRQALLTGLSPDPEARHASMAALLSAMSPPQTTRGRAWVLALGAGVAIASGWVLASIGSDAPPCPPDERLAEVWSEGRRAAIGEAMATRAEAYGRQTWTRAEAALERYADGWAEQRAQLCAAEVDDAALVDRRRACLDRSLAAMDALLEVLADEEASVVDRTVTAVARLPALEDCADSQRLGGVRQPDGERTREAVAQVRAQLEHAQAQSVAGRFDVALTEVEKARTAADEIGWGPLSAEVELMLGVRLGDAGRGDEATDAFERAFLLAEAEHLDGIAVRAGTRRAELLANLGRHEEAARQLALAQARHEASGEEPHRQIDLLGAEAQLANGRGDMAQAKAAIERQLELAESLGLAEDPQTANIVGNLATMTMLVGDLPGAVPLYQRAIALREATVGPEHPDVGRERHNYGSLLAQLGRFDEANEELERALTIKRARLGDAHPDLAYTLVSLGLAAQEAGSLDDAEPRLLEALRIQKAALPDDHPDLGFSHVALAELQLARGELDDAFDSIRSGLSVDERAWGAEHPTVAADLALLGRITFARGDARAAVVPLRRALRIWQGHRGGQPHIEAEARFELARASWAADGDRAEALALARESLKHYEDPAAPRPDRAATVKAWLAERQ